MNLFMTLWFAKRALSTACSIPAHQWGFSFQAVLLLSKGDSNWMISTKNTSLFCEENNYRVSSSSSSYQQNHLSMPHLQWPFWNSTTTTAGTCPLWRSPKALQKRSIAMVAGRSEGEWSTGAAVKNKLCRGFLAFKWFGDFLHPWKINMEHTLR